MQTECMITTISIRVVIKYYHVNVFLFKADCKMYNCFLSLVLLPPTQHMAPVWQHSDNGHSVSALDLCQPLVKIVTKKIQL